MTKFETFVKKNIMVVHDGNHHKAVAEALMSEDAAVLRHLLRLYTREWKAVEAGSKKAAIRADNAEKVARDSRLLADVGHVRFLHAQEVKWALEAALEALSNKQFLKP